jgi:hypothetical protein
MTRKIKLIIYTITTAIIIALTIACISLGIKSSNVKTYKDTIKAQTVQIDSLKHKCDELGNMDCITVNTTFTINNKNVLSVNMTQANNISRTYSTLTKYEVLHALDSLNSINNSD